MSPALNSAPAQISAPIAIVMGSDSDLPIMAQAVAVCEDFEVDYHLEIISAHRTPHRLFEFASQAHKTSLKVIIAGAGGAAHLPGMIASLTPLPVIGVPVPSRHLQGIDSLYSIVQMPAGIPVATVAIGNAQNAALLGIQILASHEPNLLAKMQTYRQSLQNLVQEKQARLADLGARAYVAGMG